MTREEAEKRGAVPVSRKTRAQAEAEGARPAPNQVPEPEPSFLEQARGFLQPKAESFLRTNPVTGPIANTAQAIAHPEEVAPRMRSLLSGATAGTAPYILSRLEGSDPEANRKLYRKAGEDFPDERMAGQFAVPVPGAGVGGAAGVAGRLGGNTALGGFQGWLNAEPGHEREDAMRGARNAAIASTAGEAVAGAAPALKGGADSLYRRAAGFQKSNLSKLSPAQQQNVADTIRSENIVPGPSSGNILGTGKKEIATRAQEVMSRRGAEIGSENTGLDAARTPIDIAGTESKLQALRNNLLPSQQGVMDRELQGPLADLAQARTRGAGYEQLARIRGAAQGRANFDPRIDRESNDARLQIARELRSDEGQQLQTNAPSIAEKLAGARRAYGGAAEIAPVAQEGANREGGNSPFGLFGGAALTAGGMGEVAHALGATPGHSGGTIAGGLATALAAMAAKRRGASMAAPAVASLEAAAPHGPAVGGVAGRGFVDWLQSHQDDAKDRLKNDR